MGVFDISLAEPCGCAVIPTNGAIVACNTSTGYICVKSTDAANAPCSVLQPTITATGVGFFISLEIDFGIGCIGTGSDFASLLSTLSCDAVGFGPSPSGPTSFELIRSQCSNVVDSGNGIVSFDWDTSLQDTICSPVDPADPLIICCGGPTGVLVTFNTFNSIAINAASSIGTPFNLGTTGDTIFCIQWNAVEQFATQDSQVVTVCPPSPTTVLQGGIDLASDGKSPQWGAVAIKDFSTMIGKLESVSITVRQAAAAPGVGGPDFVQVQMGGSYGLALVLGDSITFSISGQDEQLDKNILITSFGEAAARVIWTYRL